MSSVALAIASIDIMGGVLILLVTGMTVTPVALVTTTPLLVELFGHGGGGGLAAVASAAGRPSSPLSLSAAPPLPTVGPAPDPPARPLPLPFSSVVSVMSRRPGPTPVVVSRPAGVGGRT